LSANEGVEVGVVGGVETGVAGGETVLLFGREQIGVADTLWSAQFVD
jgi:alpha-D-ribose 1-methylphosphonate 5-triphosphate synthase subunit PhnL